MRAAGRCSRTPPHSAGVIAASTCPLMPWPVVQRRLRHGCCCSVSQSVGLQQIGASSTTMLRQPCQRQAAAANPCVISRGRTGQLVSGAPCTQQQPHRQPAGPHQAGRVGDGTGRELASPATSNRVRSRLLLFGGQVAGQPLTALSSSSKPQRCAAFWVAEHC